jgi:hypothetical protein
VRFIFDQAVAGAPAFDRFFLYDWRLPNTPYAGSSSLLSSLDPVDPDAVIVDFPTLTTPASVADLSQATVVAGAVTGYAGASNPDGSTPVGSAHAVPSPGGVTQAPDVESWGNSRPGINGTTAIDVAFDQPAFSQLSNPVDGFAVVYADPSSAVEAACEAPGSANTAGAGGTEPGGNGTATWTIVCPDDPAHPGVGLQAGAVARIVVRAGIVGATAARAPGDVVASFIQAADSPRSASLGPDIAGAALMPATSFGGNDSIMVTFNQGVNGENVAPPATPPQASRFFAVLANGASVAANAVFRSPTDPTQVLATFGPGVDAAAVGIALQAGAVSTGVAGTTDADDELAVSNAAALAVTPGTAGGPSLIAASLSPSSVAGIVQGEAALLTFDQPLAGPSTPPLSSVHGYDPDGTQLTCAPPAVGGGVNGFDSSDNPFPDTGAPATLQCDSWALGPVSTGQPAPLAAQQQIVLVTLDRGTLANLPGEYNAEQAMATTGGTGTPRQA